MYIRGLKFKKNPCSLSHLSSYSNRWQLSSTQEASGLAVIREVM